MHRIKLDTWLAEMALPNFQPDLYCDRTLDLAENTTLDPILSLGEITQIGGNKDVENRPHGKNCVLDITKEVGVRNQTVRVVATFDHGLIDGPTTLVQMASSKTCQLTIRSGRTVDGVVRVWEMRKFREFARVLTFVGLCHNGRLTGPRFMRLDGDGYLYADHSIEDHSGPVWTATDFLDDSILQAFTGDSVTYIYPDMETCISGTFVQSRLQYGNPGQVVDCCKVSSGHMMQITIHITSKVGLRYSKSSASIDSISDKTVPDPYETKFVACRLSEIGTDAGQGLFARRAIDSGTIVTFYNGIRLPYSLDGPKDQWKNSAYKIYINANYDSGERMDIAGPMQDIEYYCATIGHKMNHSFRPNCDQWIIDHPRFGVIPCFRTTQQVAKDEELTIDYLYDPYNCPTWFHEALVRFAKDHFDVPNTLFATLDKKYVPFVEHELGIMQMEGNLT